ncbi:acetoacetate--CoA ligase [Geomesophilobacter sediminis]|uniref:Acetoacetate--CoA ligase n=1 Tax=Geomesophilobacter sediminis TaxID=2798584 RepID=A0A8J7JGZ6_9BACT|nr:acetoacetate--CoA ligase [Geomesophilobacter sediminis]MBJ6726294.1 acetoacetate--CoA ligase [Geomesophilobacter sediminis]
MKKQPIWTPSPERVERSNLMRFMRLVNERHRSRFSSYGELYDWSVSEIASFWADFWDFLGIIASKRYDSVVDDPGRMPGARWFEGARLNFAENLLRYRDDRTAIVSGTESGELSRLSYAELYAAVARVAQALRRAGIGPGDRVAALLPNLPETVIAMLAATSVGATWSSCSPDFGTQGVVDRFGQIGPRVLFATDGYRYGGKEFDIRDRLAEIVERIPEIEQVVLVPQLVDDGGSGGVPRSTTWRDFTSGTAGSDLSFAQLPASHPLYIMYSSGTTGPPKCMVQGAAGILMQQLKELVLHTDLTRDDTILYLTTCGWMMWNWLVTSLAVGATIVLYEGHPFHPDPGVLWRLAADEGITVFGTSARYLANLQRTLPWPGRHFDITRLRAVLSTGSPLSEETFRYVYREVKNDLQLASISGGTDLNGCFALGNPIGAVYPGELQCRGLGMAVEVYDAKGEPVVGEGGELVCRASFPSMPLYFWNDPDGSKYRRAYFEKFPGVWTHGDWCTLTETGSMIIHGRSDATLNPGGVRIGSAELYRLMETFPEVADSLAVGQRWEGDERVILFLKLAGGELSEDLQERIRRAIKEQLSPRHVPAKILAVADIPYTRNMKKVELAVRQTIHGEPVPNREALANPEALELFRDLKELQS